MTETPTLFDPPTEPTGPQLRDQAIAEAEDQAMPDWLAEVTRILNQLIHDGDEFTTDDIWAKLPAELTTHEPRALGGLLKSAATTGRIHKVGYRPTTRPEAHARPIPIWKAT